MRLRRRRVARRRALLTVSGTIPQDLDARVARYSVSAPETSDHPLLQSGRPAPPAAASDGSSSGPAGPEH